MPECKRIVAVFLMVASIFMVINGKAYCGDLVLEVTGSSQPVKLSKSVPLKVVVRNEGTDTIRTYSIELFHSRTLVVKGPEDWKKKSEIPPPINLHGTLPVDELAPGESVSFDIDLNDYFEDLKPGISSFSVNLTILPINGRGKGKVISTKPIEYYAEKEIKLTAEVKIELIDNVEELK